MGQTKIILADPSPLFREGTRLLLSQNPDYEVVGSFDSADLVPDFLEATPARIVLMDAVMAGCSPMQVARTIRKRFPDTKIAFLSSYADEEYLIEVVPLQFTRKLARRFGSEIGDEDTIDAGASSFISQTFQSKLQERIEITKQNDRHIDLRPNFADDFQDLRDVTAIPQGAH